MVIRVLRRYFLLFSSLVHTSRAKGSRSHSTFPAGFWVPAEVATDEGCEMKNLGKNIA